MDSIECLTHERDSELYVSIVITLVPMSSDEVRHWLDESVQVFASELSEASGMDQGQAMLKAESILSEVVPDGGDTAGHSFRWIMNGIDRVGRVWFGPVADRERIVHIWDIEIDPAFRGRGFGGSAIDSVVEEARGMAATALTLDVFETNPEAMRLYEKKGFVVGHTTSGQIEMALDLS
jgi:ribosomal protein S18 acetylase RimI-like enzyme